MQAVIQAGGKGTRVSSLTGDVIPKPMLEISGYPILYHQILNLKNNNITDIFIIIGHLGDVIKDYFKDGSSIGVSITYIEENPDFPLGTAGSLYYLKNLITGDFIFLLADVFIDVDFNKTITFHKNNNAYVSLLTHPNGHPFDSDLVISNKDGLVLGFDNKDNDRSNYYYNNLVNAGIMIFSKETLNFIKEEKKYSYEKDIVIPLIKEGKVYSYKSTEYAKDMGTPERYKMVQDDFNRFLPKKKNKSIKQKCVFLDRDGTINKHVGFLRNIDDFELLDNVSEAIKLLNRSEYLVIVITNQPVIARGEVSIEQLDNIHKKMETLLGKSGAYIDDLYYCPHHPDKGYEGEIKELKIDCNCRKPKTGLIEKAVLDHNIDLENSYFIGDSSLDIKCAENAGIKSILVKTGEAGKDKKYKIKPNYIANDLLDAVNYILEGRK